MFTGIVQGTAELVAIEALPNFSHPRDPHAEPGLGRGLALGASVLQRLLPDGHPGGGDLVSFDLMQETPAPHQPRQLAVGTRSTWSGAARFGDEIGGHAMSGHIMGNGTGDLGHRHPEQPPGVVPPRPELMKYVLTKGYIGIDGISLTVGGARQRVLRQPHPETLARTNLGWVKAGWQTNIEIDPQTQAIVDTVERVLAAPPRLMPPCGRRRGQLGLHHGRPCRLRRWAKGIYRVSR